MSASTANSQTATVLFTDLVDSTALRARVGDERADEIRRAHDEAVTGAVTANSGQVVKALGDGLMAVFDASADAVAAAVAAQQAVSRLGPDLHEPLSIRVGVSIGDVTVEGGDYFGAAVNEAARLCTAAQADQILVAELVRALARGRGGFVFESYGELDLKGIPEPVPTCSVTWERPRSDVDAQVPFPPALFPSTPTGYIGRPALRTRLSEVWQDTKALGPQTVLLVGEPGIGKTRTSAEVARDAQASAGAVVLYGRCDDGLRVPYQPFVEALDHQTLHAPWLPLGRIPGELARLLPDLASRVDELPAMTVSDARTEEHRLFEAAASWLSDLAVAHPVVMVLDDLHWATKPTLQLLMHVARHVSTDPARPPLLIIGTYRDTDVDRAHPLATVLGDLRRIDGVHRVPVEPLDRDEVLELIEDAAGHPLDGPVREVAERAYEETDGNPFFVAEVLRHLVETGGVRFVDGRWTVPDIERIDVPEGVRDVIGQRLSKLSEAANDVLRAGAVVGRDFDIDLVAGVTGLDEDVILDALDEAERARLVSETDLDCFRFEHALVQTSLAEELSASRLRRMHRRIVDMLEQRPGPNLAALAHHAVEAGPRDGSLVAAIDHVLAAAEHAATSRAIGEAETLFDKALELCDEDEIPTADPRRLRARLGRGEAERDQGDPAFRDTLLGVARDALSTGADDLLLRAALENSRGFASIIGAIDTERIELLEAALQRCPAEDAATLAQLEATLAVELVFDPSSEERRGELFARAVARSDALGDPLVSARVRTRGSLVRVTPEHWNDMVADVEADIALADRAGDPTLQVYARLSMQWALATAGRLRDAAAVNAEATMIAKERGSPIAQWTIRAQAVQFTLVADGAAAASAANDAALALGQEIGIVDALTWWAANQAAIEFLRTGSFGDPQGFRAFADLYPDSMPWRCGEAVSYARSGALAEASETIDRYGLRDLGAYPREPFWINAMWSIVQAVALVGDIETCRAALEVLEPYTDSAATYLIMPNTHMGYVIGMAELALGNHERALEHLERARAWSEREFPMQQLVALETLGDVHADRDGPGDRDHAVEYWERALALTDPDDNPGWIERLRTRLGRTGGR